MEEIKNQNLIIEQRKKLSMQGVISVDSFSDLTVNASLSDGRICISGQNLKITAFSKSNGNLAVEGVINAVKFLNGKQALVKRLFK